MKYNKRLFYILLMVLVLDCSGTKVRQIDPKEDTVSGFFPIKDDALAQKYRPLLFKNSDYGDPYALYYRASKDFQNNWHISYHFFWEKEENTGSGIGPCLSQNLYTGGVSLQKTMFGKGDIEIISLLIDPEGVIKRVEYETAQDYKSSDFGVKHKHILRNSDHKEPILFKVISWNHLFDFVSDGAALHQGLVNLTPLYFTQKLWEEYEMVKGEETFFSRSRAHKEYEREFVE